MTRIDQLPPMRLMALLALLWALVTLPSLAEVPLFDYDETIYAQTAADMLHKGEWIVPSANGMQFFEKPPFTYYLMEAAYTLFGENGFAARLPSALFTLLTMLLLFHTGSRLHSPKLGLGAAMIFVALFQVGFLARAAILDGVLNFFLAGTLLYYLLWSRSGDKRDAWIGAAMMGAAVSIKGPVGVAIPGLIILIDRLWRGDLPAMLRTLPWAGCIALFLLAALPWYLLILFVQGPQFLKEFILVHNIGRAMAPMQGHGGGWHYYLVIFAAGSLPWLAFMPRLFATGWKTRKMPEPTLQLIRFGLIWTLAVMALFTLAQTKLPHYISSIWPGMALALAALLIALQPDAAAMQRIERATLLLLAPIALLPIALPLLYPSLQSLVHHPRALQVLSQPVAPDWEMSLFGALLLVGAIVLLRSRADALLRFAMLGLLLQVSLFAGLVPFASKLVQGPQLAIAAAIEKLPIDVAIYSYRLNMPSISFASGRNYRILSDEVAIPAVEQEKGPFALILRHELKGELPRLNGATPIVDRGGFLLYRFEAQP